MLTRLNCGQTSTKRENNRSILGVQVQFCVFIWSAKLHHDLYKTPNKLSLKWLSKVIGHLICSIISPLGLFTSVLII